MIGILLAGGIVLLPIGWLLRSRPAGRVLMWLGLGLLATGIAVYIVVRSGGAI